MVDSTEKTCGVCGNSDDDAPLVALTYRGESFWLCPQHMPALIHDPARLAGVLPGAEKLSPADDND